MAENYAMELEQSKKKYIMAQQKIAELQKQLQQFSIIAEREMGVIQYLEQKVKKSQEPKEG